MKSIRKFGNGTYSVEISSGDGWHLISTTLIAYEADIATTAYYIWEKAGCLHGRDKEFWGKAQNFIRRKAFVEEKQLGKELRKELYENKFWNNCS